MAAAAASEHKTSVGDQVQTGAACTSEASRESSAASVALSSFRFIISLSPSDRVVKRCFVRSMCGLMSEEKGAKYSAQASGNARNRRNGKQS